jgi:thiol-disulfide isomerase/thioredoxin
MSEPSKWLLAASSAALLAVSAPAAAGPTVDQMLAIRPAHGVFEANAGLDRAKLRIESFNEGRTSGWILKDAAGRTLRRFADTNRDNVVDSWSYYDNGVEVYRDIDTNFNGRADQHRWLNSSGTRWAIDTNEDGRIDGYRVLSAEELTQEATRALVLRDFRQMESLVATPGDIAQLHALSLAQVRDLQVRLRSRFDQETARLTHLSQKTEWVRFDGGVAQLVPGDAADGSRDVTVYRNANVVIRTEDRYDVLCVGEMVLVGRVWKLLDVPSLTPEGSASPDAVAASAPPTPTTPSAGASDVDAKRQTVFAELQRIDEQLMRLRPGDPAFARAHLERASVLQKVVSSAPDAERREWQRQLADSLLAAYQDGAPEAAPRIEQLKALVRAEGGEIEAYIAYRHMAADYSRQMQASGVDFAAVQKQWLDGLEQFAKTHPQSAEAADALLQLAIGKELAGQESDARSVYERVVAQHPKSEPARRAAGAVRRMDLVGTSLTLTGRDLRGGTVDVQTYRGKTVLVLFWATWCEPCKADMAALRQVHEKYRKRGFEVICVNVDADRDEAIRYLQQGDLGWPQVHEAGGLDSPLATQFGIISLPTMFLADSKGTILSRNLRVVELERELQRQFSAASTPSTTTFSR